MSSPYSPDKYIPEYITSEGSETRPLTRSPTSIRHLRDGDRRPSYEEQGPSRQRSTSSYHSSESGERPSNRNERYYQPRRLSFSRERQHSDDGRSRDQASQRHSGLSTPLERPQSRIDPEGVSSAYPPSTGQHSEGQPHLTGRPSGATSTSSGLNLGHIGSWHDYDPQTPLPNRSSILPLPLRSPGIMSPTGSSNFLRAGEQLNTPRRPGYTPSLGSQSHARSFHSGDPSIHSEMRTNEREYEFASKRPQEIVCAYNPRNNMQKVWTRDIISYGTEHHMMRTNPYVCEVSIANGNKIWVLPEKEMFNEDGTLRSEDLLNTLPPIDLSAMVRVNTIAASDETPYLMSKLPEAHPIVQNARRSGRILDATGEEFADLVSRYEPGQSAMREDYDRWRNNPARRELVNLLEEATHFNSRLSALHSEEQAVLMSKAQTKTSLDELGTIGLNRTDLTEAERSTVKTATQAVIEELENEISQWTPNTERTAQLRDIIQNVRESNDTQTAVLRTAAERFQNVRAFCDPLLQYFTRDKEELRAQLAKNARQQSQLRSSVEEFGKRQHTRQQRRREEFGKRQYRR